ncbi:YceI family protein [Kiloniella laminariae]|uniref:YceI family protein n=1 Tax=Kiloniella laminariae TaxID=454162 RepID=UPI00039CAB30|nr:YceI family protein [Kiloniella laminariae]
MFARKNTSAFLLLMFFLAGCGRLIPSGHQENEITAWRQGAYRLDPDHASLVFSLDHLGFSNYVGRFNLLDASLDFDPEKPLETRLFAEVAVTSLDVNNPSFAEELKGPSWFDAATFPTAYLESTGITLTGEQTAELQAKLTLKGTTHPVTFNVRFNGGANNLLSGKYTLGFSAEGTIKRSDFGISYLVPAIGDEVKLQISAEFLRVSDRIAE